jgi:hypothetical protein
MDVYNFIKETNIDNIIFALSNNKMMISRLYSYEKKFSLVLNFIL